MHLNRSADSVLVFYLLTYLYLFPAGCLCVVELHSDLSSFSTKHTMFNSSSTKNGDGNTIFIKGTKQFYHLSHGGSINMGIFTAFLTKNTPKEEKTTFSVPFSHNSSSVSYLWCFSLLPDWHVSSWKPDQGYTWAAVSGINSFNLHRFCIVEPLNGEISQLKLDNDHSITMFQQPMSMFRCLGQSNSPGGSRVRGQVHGNDTDTESTTNLSSSSGQQDPAGQWRL